jgi:tetratricopeptide (TPR) repeat protein
VSFVQDIVNGITGNLATDFVKWAAQQTSNSKLIRAAERLFNPDQLHQQTQSLLAEALNEGLGDLPDFDLAGWRPIFDHPEHRLQLIDWVLGWHEDVELTLGAWSLENAPNPELLRGLLLRLHRLIQEKKSKHFSPEFFNLLSLLQEHHKETQGTLAGIAQQVGEGFHKLDQRLSTPAGRQEVFPAEAQQTVIAKLERIETKLFAPLLPEDIETSPLVQEKISHAKVDTARQLLQEGQVKTAQHLLQRLRSDIAGQPSSPFLQFRIATNLGCCALCVEDIATAKAEFSLALILQPDNPKALTNAAQAALFNGDTEAASNLSAQARQQDPSNPHSTSVYLQALYNAGQPEHLEQLLRDEPWIVRSVPCCQSLGQIRYHERRYKEAEDLLRAALQEEPQDVQTLMLLAQVIIIPLQHTHRDDPPLVWRIPEETRARLSEAESLLTRAVEILGRHDYRRPLHTALANRAATRLMLGLFDEALTDCERVLAEDTTHDVAQLHKGLVLLQRDNPADAARCFEQIGSQEEIAASVLPRAQAYYQSNQPYKVIALLKPLWHPLPEDRGQIHIAHLLLMAYDGVNNTADKEAILHTLATTWPHDPDALSIVASQQYKAGRKDEAIQLLREALTYAATPYQRERLTLDLAHCYYDQRQYAEAAKAWATVVELSTDCPIVEGYLTALYNAGAYREALQVAQHLRASGTPRPLVTEIEALILDYIGDLKQARSLRDQLSYLEPANIAHRVHLALLDFRRGERESARQTLAQIRFEEIKENARILIQVAQLRAILEMGDVLPLVYQARRLDFGNPQIHLAYLSMFLGREDRDSAQLNPYEIGIGCTVSLQRGTETRKFTLLDETTIPRDQSEIEPTDTLAEKLMGHRKGDQVVLKSGFEDLAYEVIDVQSKYVAAFQETIAGFTTRFPDHQALQRVEWQENDHSKFFSAIDARHEHITRLSEFYARQRWPLGAIASLAGCSLFDTWAGMVNQRGAHVIVSSGTEEEKRGERKVLARANEVVLDLSALLTLWHLGLYDRVARRFRKIFVVQAVLDEVNKELSWHYLGGKPSMVVGKEGDRYVRHEISPEGLKRQQLFFESLRHFIESITEVVPASYALEVGKESFESLKDLLGEGAIASVLVAKGQGLPLYADDFGLRQIAKNDWQVEGIWSQTVLVRMREEELLTANEYHKAVRRLVLANYSFVSLHATDLLWLLQKNAMQITEEVTHIFARLQGPECNENSAVNVLADLIKAVWLDDLMYYQKSLILDLALKTLTTGRINHRVIAKLNGTLKKKFVLLPIHCDVVLQDINLWSQQKLL